MAKSRTEIEVPEQTRREAFRILVEAQDRALSVNQSRSEVASQFGLTADQVRDIEREGIDQGWPPL